MFEGYLSLPASCSHCGLNYSKFDSADGPAVFVMFVVGFIVVAAAFIVEVSYRPPYWLHAALWLPLSIVLSLVFLRPFKGIMLALQYVNDASEGRLSDE